MEMDGLMYRWRKMDRWQVDGEWMMHDDGY